MENHFGLVVKSKKPFGLMLQTGTGGIKRVHLDHPLPVSVLILKLVVLNLKHLKTLMELIDLHRSITGVMKGAQHTNIFLTNITCISNVAIGGLVIYFAITM